MNKVESVMKLKKDIEQNRANLKALSKKRQDVEEKARMAEVGVMVAVLELWLCVMEWVGDRECDWVLGDWVS